MRLAKAWTPHEVTVQDFLGENANGKTYGNPRIIKNVWIEDVQEMILDASGREIVSKGRVTFNLGDAPPLGSLVTVWSSTPWERECAIVKISVNSHPAWPSYAVAYTQ